MVLQLELRQKTVIGFNLLALELYIRIPSIAENVVGAQSVQNFIVKLYICIPCLFILFCVFESVSFQDH